MKLLLKRLFLLAVALFLAMQLVPYGRERDTRLEIVEPDWDSPRTRELARRACFDCHSNQTVWPWYSWLAPASWLVQWDVDEGREHLNFSEFDRRQRHAEDCSEELLSGAMPPWQYLPLHPEAELSAEEKRELAEGFDRTFGDR